MPEPGQSIHIKDIDGHVIIAIEEDITLSRLPAFREYVRLNLPPTYETLWFDLSQVNYIDSAGISFLLGTLSKPRTQRKRFGVINPQPMVMKVFQIAHLTKAIPIVDNETAAIRPVRGSEPSESSEEEKKGNSSILGFFRRSRPS